MDQLFRPVDTANPLNTFNDYELRYVAEHLALAGNRKQALLLISNVLLIEALASRRLLTLELLSSQSDLLSRLGDEVQCSLTTQTAHDCLTFARSELDLLTTYPELTLQQAVNQRRYHCISTDAGSLIDQLAWRRPWIRWLNAFNIAKIDVRVVKHSDWVIGCRPKNDGTAVSLDSKGLLLQWNTETGVVIRSSRLPSSRSTFLSPSGEKAVLLRGAHASVCETASGNEFARVDVNGGQLKWATWSNDEQLIVLATDKDIYLWDQRLLLLSLLVGSVNPGRECGSLNTRSDRLLTLSSPPAIWDVESRFQVAELGEARMITDRNIHTWTVFSGHRREVNAGAWSPDGSMIATAGGHGYGSHDDDFSVRLWCTATYDEVAVLRGHADRVTCLAWTSNSRRLASGSGSVMTPGTDNSVRVWDIKERQQTGSTAAHTGEVTDCVWLADDSRLISASKDTSAVVFQPGRSLSPGLEAVVSSPDGKLIAGIGLAGVISLFDEAGQRIGELRGHTDDITACAWSPDSSMLATGSLDRTVRIWSVLNRKQVRVLSGHEGEESYTAGGHRIVWGSVTGLCWSPTGERLASSSSDRSILIWNPESGERMATLLGHEGPVGSCAWSFDGSRIISRGASFEHIIDGTVRSWNAIAGFELGEVSKGDIDEDVLVTRESHGTRRGFNFAPPRRSVLSPDGSYIARVQEAYPRTHIDLVDRRIGTKKTVISSGAVQKIEWTKDARHYWVASDRSLELMSAENEHPICVFPFSTNLTNFCLMGGGDKVAAVDAAGFLYILQIQNHEMGPCYLTSARTWLFESQTWSSERWGRCPKCGTVIFASMDKNANELEGGRCDGCGSGYYLQNREDAPTTFTFMPKVPSDPEAWLRVARGLLINNDRETGLIKSAFERVVEIDRGEHIFETRIEDRYSINLDELNSTLWSVAADFLSDDSALATKCRVTARSLKGG
ncbi:MAG: WD40 repeat domain-containing protein [Pseudomonadota bacterium]